MGKNEGEQDWDYMKRETPWVYDAFDRIPRLNEATGALFGAPKTIWDGNNQVDLTNKTLVGLLQLEVERFEARVMKNEELMKGLAARVLKIEESLEGLKDERGWRLLLRARSSLLFQSPAGELAEVPLELADVLVNGRTFEGEVKPHGKYLRFVVGEDTLADIPRSLVLQLRGSKPDDEDEESGGAGEGGE